MKKRYIFAFCALLLAAVAGVLFGWRQYRNTYYIGLGGDYYHLASTRLDLSDREKPDLAALTQLTQLQLLDLRGTGLTAGEYELLRAALPECTIQWDIPFQGRLYDQGTSQLTIVRLSGDDLKTLGYFRDLRVIDAMGCRDHQTITALIREFPHCRIAWQLTVSGEICTGATTALTVDDPVCGDLELAMEHLPNLSSIHLTGKLPQAQWLLDTRKAYPHISLTWEVELHGRSFPQDTVELDLSGIPMEDASAVEAALAYFPALEKVNLSDCGIPSQAMAELNGRHEGVQFVWTIYVGRCNVRTDATVFMPFKWGYTPKYPLSRGDFSELKYCTELICMDLGHMEVDDLSFLYHMPKLQFLLLGDTEITDITPIGSLKELIYLELFNTRVLDIAPLKHCKKLQDVNLCWMFFSNLSALKDLPDLKHVWLVGTVYPWHELQQVLATHGSTWFCLETEGSSTDFGWRETPNYYRQRDLLGMIYMTG